MKRSASVRVGLVVSVALALGTGGCSQSADNSVAEATPAPPAGSAGATQHHGGGWGFFPWFMGRGTNTSGITPDQASGANISSIKRGGFGGGGSSFTG